MKNELHKVNQDDFEELAQYLRDQYKGVFDEKMIQTHLKEFVGLQNSNLLAESLIMYGHAGQRMLDIGSGYGANVFCSREHGIDAYGIEIAPIEVKFARLRLQNLRPEDDPEKVYLLGDGRYLPFRDEIFDVITILNVLEHVPDYRLMINEAIRVLRTGGTLYILCPNYAAFRREAHYLVPWVPLLPKALASFYLRVLGRNPAFLQSSIHYCTNWGILAHLIKSGVAINNPLVQKLRQIDSITSYKMRRLLGLLDKLKLLGVVEVLAMLMFINPLKGTINIKALKRR
jgi:MPBQ/MSBQ methyltransferase